MKLVSVEDEPDTDFAYRNTNYQILGKIIETLSGMTYGEYIDLYICRPLGLKHTSVLSDNTMPAHSANGYLTIDGAVKNLGTAFDPSWGGPAGDMISTAEDMLIWLDALKNGCLISKSSRLAMYDFKPEILRGDLC